MNISLNYAGLFYLSLKIHAKDEEMVGHDRYTWLGVCKTCTGYLWQSPLRKSAKTVMSYLALLFFVSSW